DALRSARASAGVEPVADERQQRAAGVGMRREHVHVAASLQLGGAQPAGRVEPELVAPARARLVARREPGAQRAVPPLPVLAARAAEALVEAAGPGERDGADRHVAGQDAEVP